MAKVTTDFKAYRARNRYAILTPNDQLIKKTKELQSELTEMYRRIRQQHTIMTNIDVSPINLMFTFFRKASTQRNLSSGQSHMRTESSCPTDRITNSKLPSARRDLIHSLFQVMEKGKGLEKTIKRFTETLPPEKRHLSASQALQSQHDDEAEEDEVAKKKSDLI